MAKHNPNTVQTKSLTQQYQGCPRANFFRRLGAYLYDLFAVMALLMFAGIFAVLIVILANKLGLINLDAYVDVADFLASSQLFALYLAAIVIAFYGYFWTKAGQTIGMKAWRLRVQNSDGSNISFTQSLIRMATSAFGLGNVMSFFSSHHAFQDTWAECEVVVLSKELNNWKGFKGMGFMDQDKK
ncbi:MAG: RDD family protein [Psychromonas sp.]